MIELPQLSLKSVSSSLAAAALVAACCGCPPIAGGAKSPLAAGGAVPTGGTDVASEPYAWKSVQILGGGFVTGVIFSPAEKDLIYARTDIGGAYRWEPSTQTWTPLTDHISRPNSNYWGIESLAPDPTDPNKVYMAVGTYTQSWAGNGAMMRSSDRGSTWELLEMPIKMGGNENGRGNGERLAVDPNKPSTILFGSRKYGLWRSDNSGQTWEEGSFPVKEEPLGVGINFVLFDKASGKQGELTPVIYAGFASRETGLYRSKDAGKVWEPVPGQPKGMMPNHAGFDQDGILYFSYADNPGPSEVRDGAVWKYNPKGDKWTDITPLKPNKEETFGYGGVSVLESAPGTLMVVTLERWSLGDQIFRSTDGGKTWKNLQEKAERDDAGAKYLYWGKDKPSSVGWMADVDIDPFNTSRAMYVTGQGIWHTDDAAEADADKPSHWVFRNHGLEETVATDFASPPSGPQLYSTVGDICGFRHDDVDKAPERGMFQNPIFGSGSSIDFAESKPDIVVRVGSPSHGGDNRPGALSKDGGVTWAPFESAPEGNKGSGDVTINADGTIIMWSPKATSAVVSADGGKTWTKPEGVPGPADLPDWAPMNFKPAADRVNPQNFYAYDAMTGVGHFSVDGGRTFKEASSGLPAMPDYELSAAGIATVPGKEGHIWLSTGKEVYRSVDGGESYVSLDTFSESYAVGFGKAAEGQDYPAIYVSGKAGDAYGIFRSVDDGATWVRVNDDAHHFSAVNTISGDPRIFGRVYIGTHGRGILYGDPK